MKLYYASFLLLFLSVQAQQQMFTGEFIHLSSHLEGSISSPTYWLKTPESVFTLLFDPSSSNVRDVIRTGDHGIVYGQLLKGNDLYMNTISVTSFQVLTLSKTSYIQAPQASASPSDFAKNIKSITFVLGLCNMSSLKREVVQAFHANFSSYIQNCTYNKYAFDLKSNIVAGPIQLPCRSTTYNYDSTMCRSNEIYGWAQYAENYARTVLGIPVDEYRHRLFMMPKGIACEWAGLGMLGCGPYCYSWYNGDYGIQHSVLLHELGHNFGLMHSASPSDEYGDGSCAMGRCCTRRCFNSPQAWILGLTEPLAVLNSTTMRPGVIYTYRLPGHLNNTRNFVKINADWALPPTSHHVSYRDNTSYDSNLLATYLRKVFIHKFWKNRSFGMRPILQGILSPKSFFEIRETRIVVTFSGVVDGKAMISVCRKTNASEICGDGIDNDCNGLIDEGCLSASPPPLPTFTLGVQLGKTNVNATFIRNVLCPGIAAVIMNAKSCSIATSSTTYTYSISYKAPKAIKIANITDFTLKAKVPCGAVILTNPPKKAWCPTPPPPPKCICTP